MSELQIDGITVATISNDLAARLLSALDQPHARVTAIDVGEATASKAAVPTLGASPMSAAVTRKRVALSIEVSTGLSFGVGSAA